MSRRAAKRTRDDKADALERVLARCRGGFAAVGLFSLAINLLVLTVPLYMLQVYDRVLTARSYDTLIMLTILAVGFLLLTGLLEAVRARVLVRAGARIDTGLNRDVFAAVLGRSVGGHEGSHAEPIRDLETVRTFLTGNGLLAFFDAPWTPLFVGLIFVMHPLLGSIAFGGALLLLLLAIAGDRLTRPLLRRAAAASSAATGFAESTARNADAIEAMGMHAGLEAKWLARHEQSLAAQAQASDRAGLLTGSIKFLRPLLQVGVLGSGAYLAIEQIITPGVMIAASIIMGRALAPVEHAIGGWRGFVNARMAYGRLRRTLATDRQPGAELSLPKPRGQLTVDGLSAAAPGAQRPFLRGIKFDLQPGQALGVIGPSAAGKSMLARLLVGIWAPLRGTVRLDGADVSTWSRADLGPHVGYLPQDVELFDGTVAENIARFGPADPAAVVAAARRAGVHDMILQLPDGYDTVIGEGGSVLSGGQRQRIGLARALFGDPALIVLDEPNSHLDTDGEEALQRAIIDLKKAGKTLVIVSHRPAALAVIDFLLLLRDGRTQIFGPRREVVSKLTRAVATDDGPQRDAAAASPVGG